MTPENELARETGEGVRTAFIPNHCGSGEKPAGEPSYFDPRYQVAERFGWPDGELRRRPPPRLDLIMRLGFYPG